MTAHHDVRTCTQVPRSRNAQIRKARLKLLACFVALVAIVAGGWLLIHACFGVGYPPIVDDLHPVSAPAEVGGGELISAHPAGRSVNGLVMQ